MRFSSISRRTSSRAPAPSIRSGAVQNSPELNIRVEPAADEDADQHRRDDDPAEHADLRETPRDRRIALAQPAPVASRRAAGPLYQRILLAAARRVRRGHAKFPDPTAAVRPKMAHDLADGVQLQPGALDMLRPLRLDIGAEAGEDCLVEGREIVAEDRLARGDGDVLPAVTERTPRRTAQ